MYINLVTFLTLVALGDGRRACPPKPEQRERRRCRTALCDTMRRSLCRTTSPTVLRRGEAFSSCYPNQISRAVRLLCFASDLWRFSYGLAYRRFLVPNRGWHGFRNGQAMFWA